MSGYFEWKVPIDVAAATMGAFAGFLLVMAVDWMRKPRVKIIGFSKANFDGGTLYKISFSVTGSINPGHAQMKLSWEGQPTVFAKWDEAAEPTTDNQFRAELVPSTYYQALINGQKYCVPVIYRKGDACEVFSAWWYGYHLPQDGRYKIDLAQQITICIVGGGGLAWKKHYSLCDVLRLAD